ncbi:MAG: hypothetical protein K8T91_15090 [Planctomycetes bacterium]|nr:hypothetical protein [Planctomycetota bacterium]
MGADFFLYSLPWTQLDEARQKLLHDTIDRLTDEQLENLAEVVGSFEEEELSEVRTAIHTAVHEYLDLNEGRDTTTWRSDSDPITRVFTGGLSWGEAPTECCQTFDIIANCEPLFDLIERWAREDSPAPAADTSRPFDILDDVTAALETCLVHFGQQMTQDDRVQRERLAASARTLLRSQSNTPPSVGEEELPTPSLLRDMLSEFCRDVEAAGRDQVAEDWPDLVITYDWAKAALSRPV